MHWGVVNHILTTESNNVGWSSFMFLNYGHIAPHYNWILILHSWQSWSMSYKLQCDEWQISVGWIAVLLCNISCPVVGTVVYLKFGDRREGESETPRVRGRLRDPENARARPRNGERIRSRECPFLATVHQCVRLVVLPRNCKTVGVSLMLNLVTTHNNTAAWAM